MPTCDATQWEDATTPKVPTISGLVVKDGVAKWYPRGALAPQP